MTSSPAGNETSLPVKYEAGWASEQVWTYGKKESCLASAGNQTPDHSAPSLVTVLTTVLAVSWHKQQLSPLHPAGWVQSQTNLCRIFGGQSGTGRHFALSI